jgi:hypothetical protein
MLATASPRWRTAVAATARVALPRARAYMAALPPSHLLASSPLVARLDPGRARAAFVDPIPLPVLHRDVALPTVDETFTPLIFGGIAIGESRFHHFGRCFRQRGRPLLVSTAR